MGESLDEQGRGQMVMPVFQGHGMSCGRGTMNKGRGTMNKGRGTRCCCVISGARSRLWASHSINKGRTR